MGGGKSKTRHGGGGGLAIDVSTFTKGENKRKIKRSTNGIDHYGLDEVEESYRSRELKNLRKTQGKGGGDFDGDLVRFNDSDDDDYGGERNRRTSHLSISFDLSDPSSTTTTITTNQGG
ncbi:hypothetical protein CSUI_008567, partial [Cystoisospora suis]